MRGLAAAGISIGIAVLCLAEPAHAFKLDLSPPLEVRRVETTGPLRLAEPQQCPERQDVSSTERLRLQTVLLWAACQAGGVRRGAAQTAQAQAATDLALAQGRPSLSLSVGADAERGSAVGWSAGLNLQWVLLDFGRREADVAQANLGQSAVLNEWRSEALQAVGQTAVLYAAAQAAIGRLHAASANLRTALESAQVSGARHEAGASTLTEMLQARTALAQAQLEQARATSQWLAARGSLAIAMRWPANTELEVETDDEDPVDMGAERPIQIEALIEEARASHPRVNAARARLAQAQARAGSVQAEAWGRVALNASSGRSRPSYGSDVEGTASAQVTWTIPLTDGGALQARKSDAKSQIQATQVAFEEALDQVELQVWQQAQALISERALRRGSRAVLESAEHALRVATERFRHGVGNFADVLNAQTTAASARFQAVESRANLLREQLRLAVAIGRFGPLPSF